MGTAVVLVGVVRCVGDIVKVDELAPGTPLAKKFVSAINNTPNMSNTNTAAIPNV